MAKTDITEMQKRIDNVLNEDYALIPFAPFIGIVLGKVLAELLKSYNRRPISDRQLEREEKAEEALRLFILLADTALEQDLITQKQRTGFGGMKLTKAVRLLNKLTRGKEIDIREAPTELKALYKRVGNRDHVYTKNTVHEEDY